MIANNSDQEKSYNLDFSIEVQDSVILKLDASHRDIFTSKKITYNDWHSDKYIGLSVKRQYGQEDGDTSDFLDYVCLYGESFNKRIKFVLFGAL